MATLDIQDMVNTLALQAIEIQRLRNQLEARDHQIATLERTLTTVGALQASGEAATVPTERAELDPQSEH